MATRKPPKQVPARSGSSRRGNGHGRVRPTAKARRPSARGSGSRRRRLLVRALIVIGILAVAGTAGYFGWLRNSSLVAVEQVRVKGTTTADADRVNAALKDAATSMTTLNFDPDELRNAVRSFPTVASVSADPDFPSRVEITVTERSPALIVESGGDAVPVAADGTVLRGLSLGAAGRRLPTIALRDLPAAGKLGGEPLAQATIAGAAPRPLVPLIEKISHAAVGGVEVVMKGEIAIRFGTPAAATQKWAAAAAVLADPRLRNLTYVDVRVPERPSVGGAAAPEVEATAPETAPVGP
ncbi:MAG: FtsQ-type POTRA domain-containing protein [bacterium]